MLLVCVWLDYCIIVLNNELSDWESRWCLLATLPFLSVPSSLSLCPSFAVLHEMSHSRLFLQFFHIICFKFHALRPCRIESSICLSEHAASLAEEEAQQFDKMGP
jgi:hypothetical protein